ncbi:hypothetical protein ABIF95_001727 [Bradyrhizobium ottawaense]
MGNADQSADDQQQTALPTDAAPERPQIGRLHADAASHHQRHGFERLKHPQQDRARDRRKRETREPRNEGAGEDGNAKQNQSRDIRHGPSSGQS